MGFTPPDSTSAFNGPPDWWSYAISDAFRELFGGLVPAPDLPKESALVEQWGSWSEYWIDLQNRAAHYGGKSNAARLVEVLADLGAIKTKLGITG